MSWKHKYANKIVSLKEAADSIKDNQTVYIGTAATVATDFANALIDRYEDFNNLTISTSLVLNPINIKPELRGHIKFLSYFNGPFERAIMKMGVGTFSPVQFSTLDLYFSRVVKSDVTIISCTPPDDKGYCNFGVINGAVMGDVLRAKPRIILEINELACRCAGESNTIHISEADMIYEHAKAPFLLPQPPTTEVDTQIASHIIDLIPDGACVQIGLGGTANAVGFMLENKKDLGVHTEMLTDSLVHLAKKGVVNCSKKNLYPGKLVMALGLGNEDLYKFMAEDPMVYTVPLSVLAKPHIIAQNDNFISINNALSIDLTGQTASEGLGFDQYSSTGGQLDFVRGSLYSKGGKSFILLPSTAKDKSGNIVSRITPSFAPGTVITTPRTDIQYVATEYGCVNLWGQPRDTRVKAMISIAHPDFRDELMKEAVDKGFI